MSVAKHRDYPEAADEGDPRDTSISVDRPTGFDVMCKIGRVEFGNGGEPAIMAAFRMIYEHNAAGEFSFPDECDGTIKVIMPPRPPIASFES